MEAPPWEPPRTRFLARLLRNRKTQAPLSKGTRRRAPAGGTRGSRSRASLFPAPRAAGPARAAASCAPQCPQDHLRRRAPSRGRAVPRPACPAWRRGGAPWAQISRPACRGPGLTLEAAAPAPLTLTPPDRLFLGTAR
jgi:hypothetical protein